MNKDMHIKALQDAIVAITVELPTCTDVDDVDDLVHLQCEYIDALEDMGVDIQDYVRLFKREDGPSIDEYDHATISAFKGLPY